MVGMKAGEEEMFAGLGWEGAGGSSVQGSAWHRLLFMGWKMGESGICPAPALTLNLPACLSGRVPVAHLPRSACASPSGRGTGMSCSLARVYLFIRGIIKAVRPFVNLLTVSFPTEGWSLLVKASLQLLGTQYGALALEQCWDCCFARTDWQNPLLSVPCCLWVFPVCPAVQCCGS